MRSSASHQARLAALALPSAAVAYLLPTPSLPLCARAPAVTLSPGGTITITVNMRVNHGGHLSFRVCPSARSGPGLTQACFDQNQLIK